MATASVITDAELLKRILGEDAAGYTIIVTIAGSHHRWSVGQETIFKRESDGKLFAMFWSRGATESQDNDDPEVAVECVAQRVTVIQYVRLPRPKTTGPKAQGPR